MRIPNKAIIEHLRKQYPAGTKVVLIRMEDPQAPPEGTIGEVLAVDDVGSLIMRWENGSGLNVVYGEDLVRKVAAGGEYSLLATRQNPCIMSTELHNNPAVSL